MILLVHIEWFLVGAQVEIKSNKRNTDHLKYQDELCTGYPLCLEGPSYNHRYPSLHFISTQMSLPQRSPPWPPLVPFFLSLPNFLFFRVLFFFFTSGVCLLSVSHMQWELQKLRAWSVVLSPSPQHSEYYWAQQKFLSYLKKYAWLPKIRRICPQHFPDSSNPQCHPGSKETARGCCWEFTLIVSELHTALHLLECWMKRHPDHTPACILPYGSLAPGAPLCFLSSPGIHAISTCSKGIYALLYNKSPITWSEVMQTLIKANEDMGAETLFAAHSTIREG